MRDYFKFVLSLILSGFFFDAHAQWNPPPPPCVDTNRVNPYYICPYFEYVPRCGCDGVTYISDCDMSNRGAVNYSQYDGPCEPLNFEIHPTLTADILNFHSILKEPGDEYVQIYNIFGTILIEQKFSFYNQYETKEYNFNVGNWELGMYIVVVSANGYYQTKKFVKSYTK